MHFLPPRQVPSPPPTFIHQHRVRESHVGSPHLALALAPPSHRLSFERPCTTTHRRISKMGLSDKSYEVSSRSSMSGLSTMDDNSNQDLNPDLNQNHEAVVGKCGALLGCEPCGSEERIPVGLVHSFHMIAARNQSRPLGRPHVHLLSSHTRHFSNPTTC